MPGIKIYFVVFRQSLESNRVFLLKKYPFLEQEQFCGILRRTRCEFESRASDARSTRVFVELAPQNRLTCRLNNFVERPVIFPRFQRENDDSNWKLNEQWADFFLSRLLQLILAK